MIKLEEFKPIYEAIKHVAREMDLLACTFIYYNNEISHFYYGDCLVERGNPFISGIFRRHLLSFRIDDMRGITGDAFIKKLNDLCGDKMAQLGVCFNYDCDAWDFSLEPVEGDWDNYEFVPFLNGGYC